MSQTAAPKKGCRPRPRRAGFATGRARGRLDRKSLPNPRLTAELRPIGLRTSAQFQTGRPVRLYPRLANATTSRSTRSVQMPASPRALIYVKWTSAARPRIDTAYIHVSAQAVRSRVVRWGCDVPDQGAQQCCASHATVRALKTLVSNPEAAA